MVSKLRSRPPIASADDFIAGANQQTSAVDQPEQTQSALLPSKNSQVRERRAESLQSPVTRAIFTEAQAHRHTHT